MCKYKIVAHYRNHRLSQVQSQSTPNIAELVLKYKCLTQSLKWHLKQFNRLFVENEITLDNYKMYKKSFERNIVALLREIICARLDATIYLRYCDKGHWTYIKLLMYWLDNLERAHMTSNLMQKTVYEMYNSVVLCVKPPNPVLYRQILKK